MMHRMMHQQLELLRQFKSYDHLEKSLFLYLSIMEETILYVNHRKEVWQLVFRMCHVKGWKILLQVVLQSNFRYMSSKVL